LHRQHVSTPVLDTKKKVMRGLVHF
jgi:hypothetical protein